MTNISVRIPYENKLFNQICAWTPHLCTRRHLPCITLRAEERQMFNLQVLNSIQLFPLDKRTTAAWSFFQSNGADLLVRGRTDQAWLSHAFMCSSCVIWCLRQAPAETISTTETFIVPFSHVELISYCLTVFPLWERCWKFHLSLAHLAELKGVTVTDTSCPLVSWPISDEGLCRDSQRARVGFSWAFP